MYHTIHNKALFDSFNESINLFRPYGNEGVPPIWSKKLRTVNSQYESPKAILLYTKNIVAEYLRSRGGALPQGHYYVAGKMDESRLNHIRE